MLSNTPIISALHHVLTLVAVLCSLQEPGRAEENLRLLDLTCSPSGNICWNAAFFFFFPLFFNFCSAELENVSEQRR